MIDLYIYSFIVPILPYMLEDRMQLDPSRTQAMISSILAVSALSAIVSSPIVGHYADRVSSRKTPLLAGLCVELITTFGVAASTNCEHCGVDRSAVSTQH